MDGRIYFRSKNSSGGSSLKELTYTTDNDKAIYQQRLFGKRHLSIRKNANRQKQKWKNMVKIENNDGIMSLFEMCMLLVVYNLDMVDTFYGLPSLMGEQIFEKAVAHRQFSTDCHEFLQHRIQIFAETYTGEVFQTLNLDRRQMFFAHLLDEITYLFPYLYSIRLSDCGIGNEHEALLQLGKLNQLKYLSLENNEIGDDGIKNLLQMRRRLKQGLNNLEILNISRNKSITFLSLSYLEALPALQAISIDATKEDVLSLKSSFSLRCLLKNEHIKALGHEYFGNDMINGWGCSLLKNWLSDFEMEEINRLKNAKKTAGKMGTSFYKSTKTVIPRLTSAPISHSIRSPVTLCLCDFQKHKKVINNQKRKRDPMDNSKESNPKKNKTVTGFCVNVGDDTELLEMYSK